MPPRLTSRIAPSSSALPAKSRPCCTERAGPTTSQPSSTSQSSTSMETSGSSSRTRMRGKRNSIAQQRWLQLYQWARQVASGSRVARRLQMHRIRQGQPPGQELADRHPRRLRTVGGRGVGGADRADPLQRRGHAGVAHPRGAANRPSVAHRYQGRRERGPQLSSERRQRRSRSRSNQPLAKARTARCADTLTADNASSKTRIANARRPGSAPRCEQLEKCVELAKEGQRDAALAVDQFTRQDRELLDEHQDRDRVGSGHRAQSAQGAASAGSAAALCACRPDRPGSA